MTTLQRLYRYSALYRMQHPQRRMQVYCVGTGKSGTHSIAAMFADTARSEHESDCRRLLPALFLRSENRLTDEQWKQFVLKRDRELWLEVDSNQLNAHLLDVLVPTFPQARFILTIRDCYGWLDSIINHQLTEGESSSLWQRWREIRFRAHELEHPPEEKPLKDRGLYTIDGYLSSWAIHNQTVVDLVPPDRLLVVPTTEITQQAQKIADFVGVPLSPAGETHAFKARAKLNILSEIDPDYIEQKVQQHCRPIMDRFFPELKRMPTKAPAA